MRAVVAQMAGLAEGAEIAQPVVGGIVVEVRGGEDDAGGAEADRVEQGGPAARPTAAVAPGFCAHIEPAPVR